MEFNLNDFKNLDTENIGEWPPTVKLCGIIIIFLLIGFLGWQYDLKNMEGKVEQAKRKEIELRNSFEFNYDRVYCK